MLSIFNGFFRFSLIAPLVILLAACSVGDDSAYVGGGDNSPGRPVPTPEIGAIGYGIKQFRFTWPPVTNATSYRLCEDLHAGFGCAPLGSDFGANTFKYNHDLFLPSRRNATYILTSCEGDTGDTCASSASKAVGRSRDINLNFAVGYFKATNTAANQQFGSAVALSTDGKTLAVGAQGESGAARGACDPADDACKKAQATGTQIENSQTGAVYVYRLAAEGWTPVAYIKAPNADPRDQFGTSVALSGDGTVLAVSAPNEESNATVVCDPKDEQCKAAMDDNSICSASKVGCNAGAGAAYVFALTDKGWVPQAYVKAPNTARNDKFGQAIALSQDGQILLVGAPRSQNPDPNAPSVVSGGRQHGAVHIYAHENAGWAWQQSIYGGGQQFGYALAVNAGADVLAIGAPAGPPAPAVDAGAVYIARRGATPQDKWKLTNERFILQPNDASPSSGCLDTPVSSLSSCFGFALALSADGNRLAIGAPTEASKATGITTVPALGTNDQVNALAPNSGAVYVLSYCVAQNNWCPGYTFIKPSPPSFMVIGGADRFGSVVSLSGDGTTLAVGAYQDGTLMAGIDGPEPGPSDDPGDSVQSGAAYVFARPPNSESWSQSAFVKAPNMTKEAQFGWSVAMARDGQTMAVGAFFENGSDTGVVSSALSEDKVGGAGAVYLY
ncbi:MAG: FG-GAP repeat protein [Chromatiales bacterium]|jgi:hypothetical protein|nr:FG-GAP repeat protein [Chromatiales bacterium]